MRWKASRGLWLLLAVYLALAACWNALVPPYENLDELEHAEFVRYVAERGGLPVHGEAARLGYRVRQESSQPPLYYLVAAAWVRLWHLPTNPNAPRPVPGSEVACSPTPTLYDKLTWQHPPGADFPWQGAARTVHALRGLSTLMQAATVAAAWELGRRLFRSEEGAAVTAALLAFNPQFLLLAADVDNDNLVVPLAAWALVALDGAVHAAEHRGRRLALFGLLTGLAALSKLSGFALLALGGAAWLCLLLRERPAPRRALRWGTAIVLPAALLVAPWVVRNLRLYGDPTALAPMLAEVGERGPMTLAGLGAELKLLALSYWGQVPCSFYPRWVYLPYAALTAVGLLGLVWAWRRLAGRGRALLVGAALWMLLVLAAWLRWDAITPAPGGRLLFPAATAFALLLAAGLTALLGRASRLVVGGMALWALLVTATVPTALFLPPPVEVAPPPQAARPAFGSALVLLEGGAEVEQVGRLACWLTTPALAAPPFAEDGTCRYLDLHLKWQATAPLPEGLVFTQQLVDPVPGVDAVRMAHHGLPAHGTFPPRDWPAGGVMEERLHLPVPAGEWRRQAWDVVLIATAEGARWPVSVEEVSAGDGWTVARVRLPDAQPNCEHLAAVEPPPRFGEAVRLVAASVETTTGEVRLCWQAERALQRDYTVFVHAYDAEGALLATGDGPPMGGAFPTSLWQRGDRIRDRHALPPEALRQAERVVVGWYDPESGARLPALADGVPLPADGAVIWERGR